MYAYTVTNYRHSKMLVDNFITICNCYTILDRCMNNINRVCRCRLHSNEMLLYSGAKNICFRSQNFSTLRHFYNWETQYWISATQIWNDGQQKYIAEEPPFLAKSVQIKVKFAVIMSQWRHQMCNMVIILASVNTFTYAAIGNPILTKLKQFDSHR